MPAGDSSEETRTGRASERAATEVGFDPDEQMKGGPRMKMAKVAPERRPALAGTQVWNAHGKGERDGGVRIKLKVCGVWSQTTRRIWGSSGRATFPGYGSGDSSAVCTLFSGKGRPAISASLGKSLRHPGLRHWVGDGSSHAGS